LIYFFFLSSEFSLVTFVIAVSPTVIIHRLPLTFFHTFTYITRMGETRHLHVIIIILCIFFQTDLSFSKLTNSAKLNIERDFLVSYSSSTSSSLSLEADQELVDGNWTYFRWNSTQTSTFTFNVGDAFTNSSSIIGFFVSFYVDVGDQYAYEFSIQGPLNNPMTLLAASSIIYPNTTASLLAPFQVDVTTIVVPDPNGVAIGLTALAFPFMSLQVQVPSSSIHLQDPLVFYVASLDFTPPSSLPCYLSFFFYTTQEMTDSGHYPVSPILSLASTTPYSPTDRNEDGAPATGIYWSVSNSTLPSTILISAGAYTSVAPPDLDFQGIYLASITLPKVWNGAKITGSLRFRDVASYRYQLNSTLPFPYYVLFTLTQVGAQLYVQSSSNGLPTPDNPGPSMTQSTSIYTLQHPWEIYPYSWKVFQAYPVNSQADLIDHYVTVESYVFNADTSIADWTKSNTSYTLVATPLAPTALTLGDCTVFPINWGSIQFFSVPISDNFVGQQVAIHMEWVEPLTPFLLNGFVSWNSLPGPDSPTFPSDWKMSVNGTGVLSIAISPTFRSSDTVTTGLLPILLTVGVLPSNVTTTASVCGGGGKCIVNRALSKIVSYSTSCLCPLGYTGDKCQLICPEKCNSRGSCVLSSKSNAQCVCDEGFLGTSCKFACSNKDTCSGNGVCTLATGDSSAFCLCDNNYIGGSCNISCSGCNASNGVCLSQLSSDGSEEAGCRCFDGFEGNDCGTNSSSSSSSSPEGWGSHGGAAALITFFVISVGINLGLVGNWLWRKRREQSFNRLIESDE
jgi:hypothetical protein